MYRPLYWFGEGSQPLMNGSLSLADAPTWSGNTATIKLKHYVWSDGSPVTTADVMFWINMLKAVGPTDWGAYSGFPASFVTRQGGQPDRAADDHEQGLLAHLVPVQRPVPDHPDAAGVGQDRVRAQRTARTKVSRLRRGLQVPGQPGQGTDQLRGLAAVVDRGRPMEAVGVQRRRSRQLRAEHEVLRAGQAAPRAVPGGAVHHGLGRVQRAALTGRRRAEDRRGLPAVAGRPGQARRVQPAGAGRRTR